MTLNGMLHTHIQLNGRILTKILAVAIVVALLFTGCSAEWWLGDGRGDWKVELSDGYSISKINSRRILLVYKEEENIPGNTIVIPNYFVTAYNLNDNYIYVEGIHTQEPTISDEELQNRVLSYYLIDTASKEVHGPFWSEDEFVFFLNSFEINQIAEWEQLPANR